MNLERVERIAEAVLYEGYMLYPYRASAVKNQQRWNFGVLCPPAYSEWQNGSESWSMQTECLFEGDRSALLDVRVRFLQIVNRSVARLVSPVRSISEVTEPALETVEGLDVDGQTFVPWQEAVEREVAAPTQGAAMAPGRQSMPFKFASGRELEPLPDADGWIMGVVIREWETVSGSLSVDVKQCGQGVFKVAVQIQNLTPYEPRQGEVRADALMHSLISAHTILGLEGGRFLSMLDPPEAMREMVAGCSNQGTWPVLVGDEGDRDTMLSSPIILYDYPEIAPESTGVLFDGTEIDEILSLRILTMSEDEKREMRQSDQRARQILERTEAMLPEQFMKLHGALRGLRPLGKEAP